MTETRTASVYKFGTNKLIQFAMSTFYLCGMWPKESSTIIYRILGYTLHLCISLPWTISKSVAPIMLEDKSEIIEFAGSSVYAVLNVFRGFTFMRNYRAILDSLNAISDFSMNKNENEIVQQKVNFFTKTSSIYFTFIFLAIISAFLNPNIIPNRDMPIPMWLPYLNYKVNDRDFYIGLVFSVVGIFLLAVFCALTPILTWYMLFASSLTLDVLGQRLRNLGYEHTDEAKFIDDLVECINLHRDIINKIKKIEDIFSYVFFIHITSSAVLICSVAYLMASEPLLDDFNKSVMYIALGVLYGYDIYVVIYYGNEISLASEQLKYCIYESNWIPMSVRCQKMMIISVEKWKKPHELVVGKIFTMRMKLLTSILNVAYSILNVLRKNKH